MSYLRVLPIAVLLLALAGCQGQPVPLTAQAGSSVLIPLNFDAGTVNDVGFGGSDFTDYQRGKLVYRLDGPSGFALTTRATSLALAYPGTTAGKGGSAPTTQIVSLVDIPASADPNYLGTHTLYVQHVYTDPATGTVKTAAGPGYSGEITILPAQISVPLPGGGTQTVVGQPTPIASCVPGGNCAPGSFQDQTANLPLLIPKPELRVTLSTSVWAADLSVTYPPSVISVLDGFETPFGRVTHLATVWMQDDASAGHLEVHAVASTAAFSLLSISFDLNDGASQILDPSTVGVSVVKAWDQNGALIPNVTVSSTGIY